MAARRTTHTMGSWLIPESALSSVATSCRWRARASRRRRPARLASPRRTWRVFSKTRPPAAGIRAVDWITPPGGRSLTLPPYRIGRRIGGPLRSVATFGVPVVRPTGHPSRISLSVRDPPSPRHPDQAPPARRAAGTRPCAHLHLRSDSVEPRPYRQLPDLPLRGCAPPLARPPLR